MRKKKPANEPAEPRIVTVRAQRVILDTDLAAMSGVEASTLNQELKRNSERIPLDFAYQLTPGKPKLQGHRL